MFRLQRSNISLLARSHSRIIPKLHIGSNPVNFTPAFTVFTLSRRKLPFDSQTLRYFQSEKMSSKNNGAGQQQAKGVDPEWENAKWKATCNCGAIEVMVNKDGLFDSRNGHICHCINCQKTAGSVFAANLIIENEYVKIRGKENLTIYEDYKTTSGMPVYRYFCKTCGNPIKSEADAATKAGKVILKLGIFREIPTPEMETFNITRHPWVPPLSGATQYKAVRGGETLPTPK